MAQSQIGSPMIVSIFIDNPDDEIEYILTKLIDNTELEESQLHQKEERP